jgi:hypothetical protein
VREPLARNFEVGLIDDFLQHVNSRFLNSVIESLGLVRTIIVVDHARGVLVHFVNLRFGEVNCFISLGVQINAQDVD